ncbi:hypothetical protein H1R20_g15295, partial [Candolleomyces eurysporus]
MVFATIKELDRAIRGEEKLTWDTMMAKLKSNHCLKHDDAKDKHRVDDIKGSWWRLFSDQKQELFVKGKELDAWLTKLVDDDQVMATTTIQIRDVQEFITPTEWIHTRGEQERKFLDVGVLRFPDIENPYIRVYHIQLSAWTSQGPSLMKFIRNRNGIKGEYNSCEFIPRRDIINRIAPDLVDQAVAEAASFLMA